MHSSSSSIPAVKLIDTRDFVRVSRADRILLVGFLIMASLVITAGLLGAL